MKFRLSLLLVFFFGFLLSCELQKSSGNQSSETSDQVSDSGPSPSGSRATDPNKIPSESDITVAFYNVENLFDTKDEPNKIDEDFLPTGKYNWTEQKYQLKLKNISNALNGTKANIIGLAEIENKKVVRDLVKADVFKGRGLKYITEESPDMRGIDVGLIYDPKVFQYVSHTAHQVNFPLEPDYTSRDFLVVEGRVKGGKALYLIVNHWPSRRGGQLESEPRRTQVASLVKKVTDDIFAKEKDANIILMGDFNDDPTNKSINEVIGARAVLQDLEDDGFYNPMATRHDPDTYGSLTYKGKWNLFDQFILSENLTKVNNPITYIDKSAEVFNPEWLRVGFGKSREAPRRAIFRGEFTEKGFSDHFPVVMKLKVN